MVSPRRPIRAPILSPSRRMMVASPFWMALKVTSSTPIRATISFRYSTAAFTLGLVSMSMGTGVSSTAAGAAVTAAAGACAAGAAAGFWAGAGWGAGFSAGWGAGAGWAFSAFSAGSAGWAFSARTTFTAGFSGAAGAGSSSSTITRTLAGIFFRPRKPVL